MIFDLGRKSRKNFELAHDMRMYGYSIDEIKKLTKLPDEVLKNYLSEIQLN